MCLYCLFLSTLRDLTFGCAVDVTGSLEKSPNRKQSVELRASRIEAVGECNPLVKMNFSFETFDMLGLLN